jgi:hypothetical protein
MRRSGPNGALPHFCPILKNRIARQIAGQGPARFSTARMQRPQDVCRERSRYDILITRDSARERCHTHINEVSINEVSFQHPQTTKVMITSTKRLAVTSSRPGYAVGGKSKPSSDSRAAPKEDCEALSAQSARPRVGHACSCQIVATDPLHHSISQRVLRYCSQ